MKLRAGLVAAIVVVSMAGCAPAGEPQPTPSATPSESPSATPSATPITTASFEVHCDADLVLTTSAETVEATPAGVPVLVSSDAPAGTYLTYGMGGDEIPAEPTTWLLDPPPGAWELSCMAPELEGERVFVTVADPQGFWSDKTPEDWGCPMGGIPSWAVGGGTGDTAEEALEALAANFNAGTDRNIARWERALVGYPEQPMQTWVGGTESVTEFTARVYEYGGEFHADPDYICESSPWP